MMWIMYIIWIVFITVCAIVEERTNKGVYGFMFLLSIVLMLYLPFMVELFQK